MAEGTRIRGLKAGDVLAGVYLLASRTEAVGRTGKTYLTLTLQDATGNLTAKVWNPPVAGAVQPGRPVRVAGRVEEYQGHLQGVVESMKEVELAPEELSGLVPASRFSAGEMTARLEAEISGLKDPWLKRLLQEVFGEPGFLERFRQATAARGVHHAYLGGLMEHSLSMVAAFQGIRGHYERYYPGLLDGDLLVAGLLLHDLGKVDEMSVAGGFEYTDTGRLLGHIYLGAARVAQAAARIPDFPLATLQKVQHLILAHHGELEYGSPVQPRLAEAFLLHYLDQVDAKLNHAWAKVLESSGGAWTQYSKIFEGGLMVPEAAAGAQPGARLFGEEEPATAPLAPAAGGEAPPRKRKGAPGDEGSFKLFPDD
jgi:3'-5' exoribonuclease